MTLDFEITELHRRVANMIQLGRVCETDYSGAIPRVRVAIGQLKTAWLPVLVQRAGEDISSWLLDEDEQVLILSPSGDISQGVVLGAINQQHSPAVNQTADTHQVNYGDGAVISYDRTQHQLTVTLPPGGRIKLTTPSNITITGDVFINGNIQASGDVSDKYRSMQADRVIYNQHIHSGVEIGAGLTATPKPSQ